MELPDTEIPSVVIHTARLILRSVTPETYLQLFNTKDETYIRHYLGIGHKEEYLEEKRRFEGGFNGFRKSFLYFQLIDPANLEILGWCGYHTWNLDHNRAEIGYMVYNPNNWGKGYMREALTEILNYGLNQMNLNRIEAYVEPSNFVSKKLVVGAGFKEEGLLKFHYLKNGVYEDSLLFGLVKAN